MPPPPSHGPSSCWLFPTARCRTSVRPLARETTLSFLDRLAGRLGASAGDLIAEFFAPGNRKAFSLLKPDGEVYLNAEARSRLVSLTGVPDEHLRRALPAWDRHEPAGYFDAGPALTFHHAGSIAPTRAACTRCTAARTGRTEPARLYTQPHQRLCARHQAWLPAETGQLLQPGDDQFSVAALPEITQAQQHHTRLLRRLPQAADAWEVARAVTAAWWQAAWPQETVWPQRLALLGAAGTDGPLDPAREAAAYPETVALTALLAGRFWQHRVLEEAGDHQPHTPADVPAFTHELAARLGRPWLADCLADNDTGPLTAWLRACWRSRAGERPHTKSMWWVAPAYREPKAADSRRSRKAPTAPAQKTGSAPDHHGQEAQGFARGLALAREFAAEHGHLCIPYRHQRKGFALGLWMSNQRATGPQMAPERSRALSELDAWWNPPWSTLWQRLYLRSRAHAESTGGLRPDQGFPGTSENLGTWLYRQCQHYHTLHPQQQKLLSHIGITAEAAWHARPRRRNMAEARDQTMAHARAYWKRHGHLCAKAGDTQDGFPVGTALSNLRVRARRGSLDPAIVRELTAMDPWWAPPWSSGWQRACYRVRDLVRSGTVLDPASGFTAVDDETGQWLYTQCVTWADLAEQQRQQLTRLGLTTRAAAAARPNPATRHPSLETGLHYARSYALLTGGLCLSSSTRHEGFALGRWLLRQRHQAAVYTNRFAARYPADPQLSAVDPWWNPPWGTAWETNYDKARRLAGRGLRLLPTRGFPGTPEALGQWLYAQCLAWPELHPEQQRRLVRLGITEDHAHRARPRRVSQQASFTTGLAHAHVWAARHGHLAVPGNAREEGHPLGSWLADKRKRASSGRLPLDHIEALDRIDPWWNPPWTIRWQYGYHAARAATDGLRPDPAKGFPTLPAGAARWLTTQCSAYSGLHPGQHQLLADIGITAEVARTLRPRPAPRRRPHPGAPRPRPTTVSASIDAGLPYARAWAHAHNGLGTAQYDVEHDGFPLGWWLYEQRKRARAHVRRTGRPWPHDHALTALDRWWNPPWRISWQHSYTALRNAITENRAPHSHQRRWLTTQQADWTRLHPDQRALLTDLNRAPR
ncbi:Helicase associated domain protein [Streptomyces nanhaiensis]|uniref:Helicase associated domain protein n=1 Tax=Streptomyces nanhaiensis TaxID=679319 RepID=UPI00399CC041